MARSLSKCWPALIVITALAAGCGNSADTSTTESPTSSSVATTLAASTTTTFTTSTATTIPPTTTSTTWEPPTALPPTLIMGRLTRAVHGQGFTAARSDPDHPRAIAIGPATVTIEGYGEVFVPAGTIINKPCTELDLVFPGEAPWPPEPCHVRVDLDEDGNLLALYILSLDIAQDIDFQRVYTIGDVVGATDSTVIIDDRVHPEPVVWPLAVVPPGTQEVTFVLAFVCGGDFWLPPEFPVPPAPTRYLLTLDLNLDAVVGLECYVGF